MRNLSISPKKIRLDLVLIEKGLAPSRQQGRSLIMAGKVLVNNQRMDKPGVLVSRDDDIVLKGEDNPYVSRGGIKLEKALKVFQVEAKGLICLDVGASTGGFTDCLLQQGARRVFAVDVGYGQLAWRLRQDPRVILIERTNIRYLPVEIITSPIDVITIDVSFISLKIVVPAILKFMEKDTRVLALIKPQFEVGKGKVGKGGVVRDPAQHDAVIKDLQFFLKKLNLVSVSVTTSPVLRPKGNKEFFIYLKRL